MSDTAHRSIPIELRRPPAGWDVFCDELSPGQRVVDYRARRSPPLVGRCSGSNCRRTVTLDPAELCKRGLGALSMAEVQRLHACHRIGGCRLHFDQGNPPLAIPLATLAGRPHVRLQIYCGVCQGFRLARPAAVARQLAAGGKGGPETLVNQLAAQVKGDCPRCGRKAWALRVLWKDTESVGWWNRGERVFDEMPQPPWPRPGEAA
jgi:hypothetical protein